MVKEGVKYLFRIIVTICVVVISIPLWESSFGAKDIAIVNDYKDASIVATYGDFDLTVCQKNKIDSINPTIINLKNINGYSKSSTLYLVIDDNTTIDSKFLNIKLDDKIYSLSNIKYEYQNGKKYYSLENITLDAYDYKDIEAIMWIDDSIKEINDDDILVMEFLTK